MEQQIELEGSNAGDVVMDATTLLNLVPSDDTLKEEQRLWEKRASVRSGAICFTGSTESTCKRAERAATVLNMAHLTEKRRQDRNSAGHWQSGAWERRGEGWVAAEAGSRQEELEAAMVCAARKCVVVPQRPEGMLKTLISYIHIDRYTELMGVMQELKTLGVIPVTFIREIRYMRDESDDHLNCFEVVTFQTRYVVSAECQEDMRAWASAIVYARNLHLNQGHGSKKVGSLKVDILDVEKLRMCSGEVLWFRGK